MLPISINLYQMMISRVHYWLIVKRKYKVVTKLNDTEPIYLQYHLCKKKTCRYPKNIYNKYGKHM